ncbi:Hypothetical protein R9X50_00322300 [Acrodontium crateriforme]|uniref:Adenylyltransferase and sulfurtransferase uba4 n=1 Tax=Acrodontium crateriforme TaxID=150365 RepID=A0AAQ3R429_9PEZI|nr:Hypothetical protein R9X50_00322300 [Acrodontium crateriforme]
MDSFQTADNKVHNLRRQVEATENQLRELKSQLQQAEQQAEESRNAHSAYLGGFPAEWIDETLQVLRQNEFPNTAQTIRQDHGFQQSPSAANVTKRRWPLDKDEYIRYGRQLIMPEIGLHGQLRLKNSKVLVVGCGGLGCPAAAYLAGAGVGTLGLIDGDTVEVSNLHRQIIHSTTKVGMTKVDSAYEYLAALNPSITYNRYPFHLSPDKALEIFEQYDLILDCTDHPTSRYLISDAAVLTGRPLVSASALKTEGQLIVLNNPPKPPGDLSGGPCYRCVFPTPPPADSVVSCGEGGIVGPVVGLMGVLQALEAIKVLTAKVQPIDQDPPKPTLLMFSAYNTPQFRSVRLRSRRKECAACSSQASITRQALTNGSLDYVAFCGAALPINVLPPQARVAAADFARLPQDGSNKLIDVRDETQYAICALRGSINVPWTGNADSWITRATQSGALAQDGRHYYIVCRLGNDSQLAAQAIMDRALLPILVKDIKGGFKAWREEVDPSWPDY